MQPIINLFEKMRKIIFILLACLITMSFVAINDSADTNEVRIENVECRI